MVPGIDGVAFLRLFRFPSMFTAIADSAAGYLLFHAPSYEPGVLALLALTSAGLHCFGSALKDLADLEKDRQSDPGRVLPSGRLSMRQARWSAVLALAASFEGMMWLGTTGYGEQVVLAWGAAVLCVYAYGAGWARLSPVLGLVRAANLMIGVCVGTGVGYSGWVDNPVLLLPLAIPAFIYATALAYVQSLGDPEAEGSRLRMGVGAMMAAACLSASLHPPGQSYWFQYEPAFVSWTSGIFRPGKSLAGMIATGILSGWLGWRAWTVRDRTGTQRLVRESTAGLILLDSSLLISNGCTGGSVLLITGLLAPTVLSFGMLKKLA